MSDPLPCSYRHPRWGTRTEGERMTTARKDVQTAIVLQGGGALGAYEYGVLKALYEHRPGSGRWRSPASRSARSPPRCSAAPRATRSTHWTRCGGAS